MQLKKSLYIWVIVSFCVLLLLIAGSFTLKHMRGYYIPIPVGIRHVANLIHSPDDWGDPIVMDRCRLWERGYTKTYALNPKYYGAYMICISVEDGWFESTYKFQGKVKLEYYWKERLLYEDIITSNSYSFPLENDMSKLRKVALKTFDIPLQGQYANNISIKITVIEPDTNLERYMDLLNMSITVCPIL